jgi:hypothetical protein
MTVQKVVQHLSPCSSDSRRRLTITKLQRPLTAFFAAANRRRQPLAAAAEVPHTRTILDRLWTTLNTRVGIEQVKGVPAAGREIDVEDALRSIALLRPVPFVAPS